jgi:hypothetical protein
LDASKALPMSPIPLSCFLRVRRRNQTAVILLKDQQAQRSFTMKMVIALLALGVAVGTGASANAKGCIKGAIVGGVAGHMAGHGAAGAAAGCIIGHHEANKRQA